MSSITLQKLLVFFPPESHIKGTSVKEQGLEVSIERLPGETIQFIHVDLPSSKRCLKMQARDVSCCDYLIFYTRQPNVKEVFCLLELKGKHYEHAVDQIMSTYKYLSAAKRDMFDNTNCQPVWSINICLRGGALKVDNKEKLRLEKIFGKGKVRIKQVNKKDTQIGDELLRKLG